MGAPVQKKRFGWAPAHPWLLLSLVRMSLKANFLFPSCVKAFLGHLAWAGHSLPLSPLAIPLVSHCHGLFTCLSFPSDRTPWGRNLPLPTCCPLQHRRLVLSLAQRRPGSPDSVIFVVYALTTALCSLHRLKSRLLTKSWPWETSVNHMWKPGNNQQNWESSVLFFVIYAFKKFKTNCMVNFFSLTPTQMAQWKTISLCPSWRRSKLKRS